MKVPFMKSARAAISLAASLCTLSVALSLPAFAEAQAFRDDFDSFDSGRWYVSDGWSNGDWQACTWSSEMISVEAGILNLRIAPTAKGPKDYLCGEIQTDDPLHYGTYEARIRTDAGSGINAALFTYIGPVHEKPHYEIDIEILGRNPSEVQFNTYLDGEPAYGSVKALPDDSRSDEEFHTYAFIWEEGRLRWYVDGLLLHEATGADLPQEPQKLFLSHWNTTTFIDWMGAFEDPGRPLDMAIDWVAYTPLGADCQFEESIACLAAEP